MRELLIKLLIFFMPLSVIAGGDPSDGHSHGEEKPTTGKTGPQYFTVNNVSDKFELVLRYKPIKKGEHVHLTLFISDYETNVPVTTDKITITSLEDSKLKFDVIKKEPGVYEVETIFPQNKKYTLAVNLSAQGRSDLISLPGVEPGKILPAETEVHDHESLSTAQIILLVIGTFLLGIIITFLFVRKRNRPGRNRTISIMLIFLFISNDTSKLAFAHGDEDHGDEKKTPSAVTDELQIPKETQFLFNIRTAFSKLGNFKSTLRLYGKVIPDINGRADILVPQNGVISEVKVTVGQKVERGQPLAVFEQTLTASEQLEFTTNKNNASAELEDAKKDYERLKKIEDVIAKKDLQDARIRYEKAVENVNAFNSSRKVVTLTSPIAGLVDNFQLSPGVQVMQNDTLFKIINTNTVRIQAQVFDKDLSKITNDSRFLVECVQENHRTEDARFIAFGNTVNPVNQASLIILEVDNSEDLFKPGQFATIDVMIGTASNDITIPSAALSDINGKPVVFSKIGPETFKITYVQPGASTSEQVIIQKALAEKVRVVTDGAYQVKSIYMNQ